MYVICIEGCHGSGKTAITQKIDELSQQGVYNGTIDEGFLDMPKYQISPQSFTMEMIWISRWFEKILKIKNDVSNAMDQVTPQTKSHHAPPIFFADRSPYSALFYAPNGLLLRSIIDESKKELAESGIYIKTIYIQVGDDILWDRISQRLEREPHRKKYNEDSHDWMKKTVGFYEGHSWDAVIKNNGPIDEVMTDIEKYAKNIVAKNITN